MTTLLREQLTTLLALVIFLGVKQEAFMFNYAVVITTAPVERLPSSTCCSTR